MNNSNINIHEDRNITKEEILDLYHALNWSSVQKPDQLYNALHHSHSLVTAWDNDKLIGLANAISDGHLVVYYPHLLVHPEYQKQGIGKKLMQTLLKKYSGFHQHMLVADGDAIDFYKKMGFERAGKTEPMWIYQGDDH